MEAALVLAAIGGRLRLAVPGYEDAKEYRWSDGNWLTEASEPVWIDFEPADVLFESSLPRDTAWRSIASGDDDLPLRPRPHGPFSGAAGAVN